MQDPVDATDPRSGFALVLVVWAVGLIGLVSVGYVAAARYRAIEAGGAMRRNGAEALATAGIQLAILDHLPGVGSGRPSGRQFGRDGRSVLCRPTEGAAIATTVTDEGGKVDLNAARPELVEALFRSHAAGSQVARHVLAPRRQSPALPGQPSAEASIRTVFELDQLTGMDRASFEAAVPLVTVHSRSPGIDIEAAPLGVLRALSQRGEVRSRADAGRALPSMFAAPSPGTVLSISVEVVTASNGRASREAVVEFSPQWPAGYRIREWRDGPPPGLLPAATLGLPPC